LPAAFMTFARFGISVVVEGPTARIFVPRIITVASGCGGAPVVSMTVAWVMARIGGRIFEQELVSERVARSKSAEMRDRRR
jgi:hypothetical protein